MTKRDQEKTTPKTSTNSTLVKAILADPSLLTVSAESGISKLVEAGVIPEGTPRQALYQARTDQRVAHLREELKAARDAEKASGTAAVLEEAAVASNRAEVLVDEVSSDAGAPRTGLARFLGRFPAWGAEGEPSSEADAAVVSVASRDGVTMEEHEASKANKAKKKAGRVNPVVLMWQKLLLPLCTFVSRMLTGWHERKVQCDTAGQAFYQFIATSKVVMLAGIAASVAAYTNAAYLSLLYVSLTFIAFRAVWHVSMYVCGIFTAAEAGYRKAEQVVVDKASSAAKKVANSLEDQTAAVEAV